MRSVVRARISSHAVERWQRRVDGAVAFPTARQAIAEFLGKGRARPTPRSWMREVKPAPGLRFVYSAEKPGVCVLVREGVALTVLTRAMMCSSGRDTVTAERRSDRRPRRDIRWRRDREAWLAEVAA